MKIRDIERLCNTTVKERKIPTAKDIVSVKSGKLFANAMEVMENKELEDIKVCIQKAAMENGFEILDLAAAFMQMNMGDEPTEIQEEKPFFERGRSGGNSRGRSGDQRRSGGRGDDRSGRGDRGRSNSYGDRSRGEYRGRSEGNRSEGNRSDGGKRRSEGSGRSYAGAGAGDKKGRSYTDGGRSYSEGKSGRNRSDERTSTRRNEYGSEGNRRKKDTSHPFDRFIPDNNKREGGKSSKNAGSKKQSQIV